MKFILKFKILFLFFEKYGAKGPNFFKTARGLKKIVHLWYRPMSVCNMYVDSKWPPTSCKNYYIFLCRKTRSLEINNVYSSLSAFIDRFATNSLISTISIIFGMPSIIYISDSWLNQIKNTVLNVKQVWHQNDKRKQVNKTKNF